MAITLPSDTHVPGDLGHAIDHDNITDCLTEAFGINARNTAYAGGAKGDGVTDDTAAIQAAINAAAGKKFVYLPDTGNPYVIKQPLVPDAVSNRIWMRGDKGATQSGAGAGANIGTTIKVSASFTNPSSLPVVAAIAVLFGNGTLNTSSGLALDLRDLWIDGSVGPASVDGVAMWGQMQGCRLENVGLNGPTGNGVAQYKNTNFGSNNGAQGLAMLNVICEAYTGTGFVISGTDSTVFNCHAQSGTGDGWSITGANNRFILCRGDLASAGHGFTHDAGRTVGATTAFDANTFTGCGTQGNSKNGMNVTNSSGTGQSLRCPVILSACTFDGDGANGGAGGGGFAGLAVAGRNDVFADNVNVLCATKYAGAAVTPDYAVATASIGSGPGVPDIVSITSGFLNGFVAITHDNAPSTDFALGRLVRGYAGGQFASNATTTIVKPAVIPAAAAGFTPSDPASTISATLVMMGLGTTCAYTPASSGTVLITVTGYGKTTTGATTFSVGARYGTGTAPANAAAVTGTNFGATNTSQTLRGQGTDLYAAFSFTAVLSLTAGTAYWFDVALLTGNVADAASLRDVAMSIMETA